MFSPSACAAAITLFVLASSACGSQLEAQNQPATTSAHVTLQIDSSTVAEFDAHGLDVDVTHLKGSGPAGSATAEIRIVKQAGSFTGTLVSLSASGDRAPSGAIQLFDSLGAPLLTLHLADVSVVSDHIALSSARTALMQQSISQQEALTQLTADSREAENDLATAEALGKSHVTTRQDLARARERAQELQQRLKLAQQRQTMLASQLASQSELDESLILRFDHMTVDASGPGGHGEWSARSPFSTDTAGRPTGANDLARLRHSRPDGY